PCARTTARLKIVLSDVAPAILPCLYALCVGVLPALVSRFQGHHGGLLASFSTPALGCVVVSLLIAKSIGVAVLLYWQSAFIARDENERTVDLFGHLLDLPFGETSETNTSDFVRDLHVSIPLLYRGAGIGLALLMADGLGLLGLGVVVILTRPATGLTLFAFFAVAAWFYNALIRSRIS